MSSTIRASEIGQWVYCHRAWWLARQGHRNRNVAALKAGSVAHEQHARQVAGAHRTRTLALATLALGLIILVIASLSMAF